MISRLSVVLALSALGCASAPISDATWSEVHSLRYQSVSESIDLGATGTYAFRLSGLPKRWLALALHLPIESPLTPGETDILSEPGTDAEVSISIEELSSHTPFRLSGTIGYWSWGGVLGEPALVWSEYFDWGPHDRVFTVNVSVTKPASRQILARFEVEAIEFVLSGLPTNKGLQLPANAWTN